MPDDPKNGLTDEQAADLLTEAEYAGMMDENLVDDTTPIILEHEKTGDEVAEKDQPDPELDEAGKPAADAPTLEQESAKHDKVDDEPDAGAVKTDDPPEPAADLEQDVVDLDLPEPVMPPAPGRLVAAPENADKRLAEIDKLIEETSAKFDDGEIDAVALRRALKPLQEEENDLRLALRDATKSAEDHAAYVQGVFQQFEVPKFLRANPTFANGPMLSILDAEVRKLQAADLTKQFDPKHLTTAADTIRANFAKQGIVLPQGKAAPAPAAKTPPKRPAPPPTLAHVPQSDVTEASTDKFRVLDKLRGEAFEDALAALPDAEREAYLERG